MALSARVLLTLWLALISTYDALATSAVFVEDARLADRVPTPAGDEWSRFKHDAFQQSVGVHSIVEGKGTVVAIRQDVVTGLNADGGWYEKVSISVPRFAWSYDGGFGDEGVSVRYVVGSNAFTFSPSDRATSEGSGRLSIRRTDDPDVVAIEFRLAMTMEARLPGSKGYVDVDCTGKGQARRALRADLTPWYGAPVEYAWRFDAVHPRKAIPDAHFYLYCTTRKPAG